jgi:hypothetical protein
MKRNVVLCFAISTLVCVLSGAAARADSVGVTLSQASLTGVVGSTVTFDATIANLSSDTIFLNGDASVTSSTLLTVSDAPFLANSPLSLDPGQVSGPFALFSVFINPTLTAGTYGLNSFSILGGLDSGSSDTIGTASFSVTVQEPTAVPEPATVVLLFIGLAMLGMMNYSRYSRRNS